MTYTTGLLCNNFGGIRQKNAVFSSEQITAQDLQNVELYYTGTNSGVGIRTAKGNVKITERYNNINLIVYDNEFAQVSTNGSINNNEVSFYISSTLYENFVRDTEKDTTIDDVVYFAWTNNETTYYTTTDGTDIIDIIPEDEKVIGLWQSEQAKNRYLFVYTENETNGKFYSIDVSSKVLTLHKTLEGITGVANGLDVVQGYSDLFFFTNGSAMFTIEMNHYEEEILTGVEIIDMEPTGRFKDKTVKGLLACVFNNRLFISDGTILWWSVTANIYDFLTNNSEWVTSAGYLEFSKPITALHEYLGSMAIFHKDSSELLSVSGGEFTLGDESPAGCASFKSLIFHDTNLYFYDDTKKAVFSFQEVVNGEKVLGQNIGNDVQDILLTIDETQLNKIRALSVFLEGRNEIWWLIPTKNDDSNHSTILIFDYLKGEWVKRKSQKINSIVIFNNILYSGGNKIFEEYKSNTFNGEFIEHYYNCSPMNLGAMNTLKVLAFPPRVSFDMPYSNQFYVKYVKNYNTFRTPKVKFIRAKLKNFLHWNLGFWNQAYWADKNTNSIGKFPSATFKTLEISIYTTSQLEEFSIKNIEFSKIKVKQV